MLISLYYTNPMMLYTRGSPVDSEADDLEPACHQGIYHVTLDYLIVYDSYSITLYLIVLPYYLIILYYMIVIVYLMTL